MKMKLEEWQQPIMCSHCKTILWSDHEGEYVTCECGDCFCDQTKYYGRYGGDNLYTFQPQNWEDEDYA